MRKPECWHDRIYNWCIYTQTMEHSLFLARFPTHNCPRALLQYVITQSRSRVKLHPQNDEHFILNLIESIIYIMYERTFLKHRMVSEYS